MNQIRIRPMVWPHLIIAAVAMAMALGAYWVLFLREDADPPDTEAYFIVGGMALIAAGIVFFALKIAILRPDVIRVNGKGFEYNPGGVSSGFVAWEDVDEVKRVAVRTTQGSMPGPVMETTLAVKLKYPEDYRKQFNPALRKLMQLNEHMYDADIFIRLSSLGKEAEQVEAMMMRYGAPAWMKARDREA